VSCSIFDQIGKLRRCRRKMFRPSGGAVRESVCSLQIRKGTFLMIDLFLNFLDSIQIFE